MQYTYEIMNMNLEASTPTIHVAYFPENVEVESPPYHIRNLAISHSIVEQYVAGDIPESEFLEHLDSIIEAAAGRAVESWEKREQFKDFKMPENIMNKRSEAREFVKKTPPVNRVGNANASAKQPNKAGEV